MNCIQHNKVDEQCHPSQTLVLKPFSSISTCTKLFSLISLLWWACVRCRGTNGSGPIGRLGRPIRVTFRNEIESLLRGQVILSI
jgi:hypothetical protein